MKNRNTFLKILTAACLSLAATVHAQETKSHSDAMAAAGHTQHSASVSGGEGLGGFTFTGYVDALAAYSTASPNFRGGTRIGNPLLAGSSGGLNLMSPTGLRPCRAATGTCRDNDLTFLAGEVLLQMQKDFGGKGIAAATLSFAEAGSGTAGPNETGSTAFVLTVEEAYAGINIAENLNFYMGRYIAPIGIESVWSNARKNITMSNLFAGSLPFYYTGAMLAYEPESGPFFKAMIFNDALGTNDDGGVDKGFSFLAGITQENMYAGLTWVASPSTQAGTRKTDWWHLFNLDLTFTADKASIAFETVYSRNFVSGSDQQWIGAMAIVGFKATDAVEVGLRAEYNYLDPEFAAAVGVDPATFGGAPLGSFKGMGLSPFVIYTVTDGLFVRGEYRYDVENPFGGSKKGAEYGHAHLLGLNLNATF